MPLKIWIGENIEHPQELKAASMFLEKLDAVYKDREETCHVLFNFLVDSNPLDAVIIKSDSIVILELKEVSCPVTGGENGTWFLNDNGKKINVKGGIHGNPYKQVRAYRFAFRDLLVRRAKDFLAPQPESVPFNVALFGIVVFSPIFHPKSLIKVSEREKWFRISGVDRLHETICQCTSPRLNLSDKEMVKLITEVLQLEQAQMVGWTPIKPNPISEQVINTNKTSLQHTTAIIKQENISSSNKLSQQQPSAIREEIVFNPAASKSVSAPECIVCMFGGESCDRSHLSGSLKEIDIDNNRLQIEVKEQGLSGIEHNIYKIEFDPSVNTAISESLLFLRVRLQSNKKTNISFWHLTKCIDDVKSYKMNSDSIFLFEPDWLINVNDLTNVEYCHRQLLVKKYVSDNAGAAAILGNVVHQAFSEIWKGDKASIKKSVQSAVNAQALPIIVSSTVPEDLIDSSQSHIDHLLAFANKQTKISELRNETFVLSPILGLKGRIDAVWERNGKPVVVGELKTGKSQGSEPKPEHVYQVAAYSFMLMARGDADPKNLVALILYSGNDSLGVTDGRNVKRMVTLDLQQMKKVLSVRNSLVAIELSGFANYTTNLRKCRPCSIATDCYRIGKLSNHNDPRPEDEVKKLLVECPEISEREISFFSHFSSKLIDEFIAAKSRHSDLWNPENIRFQESGKYLKLSAKIPPEGELVEDGSYWYFLTTESINNSELRAGDYVILCAQNGPVSDRAAIATILDVNESLIFVRMTEELIFQPTMVYSFVDESLIARTFRGLYRFLTERPELMKVLFTEEDVPTYNKEYALPGLCDSFTNELNSRQTEAVLKSLKSDHFLLVNGPPGAGKTTLITRIVLAHLIRGERVLITTSTNRALDQVLMKIVRQEGYSDKLLRLGSGTSTSDTLKRNTVTGLVKSSGLSQTQAALISRPIVGATISTLLSGGYSIGMDDFDLVIIDEATQSTIPATLGAISFGKRFVLIGDPKQLPPIVQDTNITAGSNFPNLNISLFEYLYGKFGSGVCVALEEQYRMNDVICSIPSAIWYEPDGLKLKPADKETASKRIEYKKPPQNNLSDILSPEKPFVFVDVEINKSCGERTNSSEADLVVEIIVELLEVTDQITSPFSEENNMSKSNCISVAVISPYRSQVALIRRKLLEREICQKNINTEFIDSVDRFQGSEADLVIISLSPWTEKVSDHISNPQRLNVAMTRARKKLIMLGNCDHLKQHDIFKQLFDKCNHLIGESNWYCSSYQSASLTDITDDVIAF